MKKNFNYNEILKIIREGGEDEIIFDEEEDDYVIHILTEEEEEDEVIDLLIPKNFDDFDRLLF